MPKTRHKSSSELSKYLGGGKELLETEVPTLRAALRNALLIREERDGGMVDMGEVMDLVVCDVIRLW